MVLVLSILNALAALASAAFGVVALVNPQSLSRSEGRDSPFFSWMYAARTIPLGLFVALVPFLRHGSVVALILSLAALVQLVDAGIGLQQRNLRLTLGALVAAVIHIVCGLVLL